MKCKFCNSSTEKIFENGVQCSKCRSVSVEILPSDEVIADYYNSFNDSYHGGGPKSNQIKYAKKYLKLIEAYSKDFKTLLDVGCSNSPFPNLAYSAKYSVSVLDIKKPVELDENIIYYEGFIDANFNIPESTRFEVVTAWAVIEHVKYVEKSFENLSNSLLNNGYLFLTTPEIGTKLSNWNFGKTPWFSPPEHLHIMSPDCLNTIGKKYGLHLVSNGHFEISTLRYFVRYYVMGFIEAALSFLVGVFSREKLKILRRSRISRYKGIHYLVFKKIPL